MCVFSALEENLHFVISVLGYNRYEFTVDTNCVLNW